MPLSRHAPAKSVKRHKMLYSLRQDILYTWLLAAAEVVRTVESVFGFPSHCGNHQRLPPQASLLDFHSGGSLHNLFHPPEQTAAFP